MNNRFKRKMAMATALALMVTLVLPLRSMADDSVVEIKRSEVGARVEAYSPTVKGLANDLTALSQDYLDYKNGDLVSGLQELYDSLGTYKALDAKFQSITSPDFPEYMGYMMLVDPSDPGDSNLALALAMLDGDELGDSAIPVPDGTVDTDLNGLSGNEEVALAAESAIMTPLEYGTYLGLQSAFSAMGITSPSISKSQEYSTFIYPLEVVPKSLQNGMAQLRIGLDQAEAGIASGGEALFDGAKQLEGVVALQKLNYEIAQDALVTAEKKFEYGQISQGAYETAVNDEKIAALNYQTIERQYNNLIMQMNVMLGQEVLTTTVLVSEVGDLVELNALDTYIESGLKKRAELKSNSANIAYQSDILDYTDKYLGSSSIDYKTAENALADYALEKAYETNAVTADIMKAYKAVAAKEENLAIKKLSLEDAQRQQSDLKLQQELGFVTESMAKQIDVLVLLAENDYEGAYREYLSALTALELASDIGGGMSFE